MKTWLDWCRNRAVPFSVMDFANNAVLLDPGEFVARWGMCPMCLGCKKYYNQYADREFECSICNGTGRVSVPVEVGK